MEIGPSYVPFECGDPDDPRYCPVERPEIVRRLVAAHGQYLVAWARDGDYAYYDSKLLPKPPGLGNRDPLREAADEAKRHGLPLITYSVIQQGGHFLDAHPELHARDAHGAPIGRFCFNSGYLEVMKKIASEQLAYGVTGCYFDMPAEFGPPYGCWCDACRRQFEAQYGRPMPKGVTWDEDWERMLEFRYHSVRGSSRRFRNHVKSVNPRATVDFNYFGHPPNSWEMGQRPVEHAGNGDFVTGEAGNWGFGPLAGGLHAEFYRAATPGVPYQLAMQRSLRIYADQTTRPLADIRWELFTLLAHGAMVTMVDKTGCDGSLDPVVYERTGAAFAEALQERDDFGHAPVYDVGLYYSSRSRDWIGREKPETWFRSFLGAAQGVRLRAPDGRRSAGRERDPRCPPAVSRRLPAQRRHPLGGRGLAAAPLRGTRGQSDCHRAERAVQPLGQALRGIGPGRVDRGRGRRLGADARQLGAVLNPGRRRSAPRPPPRLAAVGPRPGDSVPADHRHGLRTTAQAVPDGQAREHLAHDRRRAGWPGGAGQSRRQGDGAHVCLLAGRRHGRRVWHERGAEAVLERGAAALPAAAGADRGARQRRGGGDRRAAAADAPHPPDRLQRARTGSAGHGLPERLSGPDRGAPMYRVAVELAGPLKEAAAGSAATVLSARGNRVEATVHDVHEVLRIKY